ncbi:MAG: polyribonucleotide nucleotidyltransferase, partial [Chloroflexota bacterium]
MFNVKQYNVVVGGNLLTVETGKLANLAGGAVTVRCGDTMILATATMGRQPRAGIDFFPLSVDFEERLYSIGKIPGSFFRREGRPSEEAILVSRLIDRPLRPLFPKDLRNEVQIIITALSADHVNPPDMLAIVGASAALTISDVPFGVAPFSGPIGAVRVGLIDGEFVLNPTYEQMAVSKLDLRLAGTREAVLMVECAANEVPEDQLVAALELAHKSIAPMIDLQVQMAKEIGKTKRTDYPSFKQDPALLERVSAHSRARVASALKDVANKEERNAALDAIEAEAVAALVTTEVNGDAVKDCFHSVLKAEVRREIVDHSRRPDGRGLREIRPISIETGLSPRAHGSGLFTRGETQILSLATLGTPRDAQMLDTLSPQTSKRYMHHYNFPPYSTGEARFLRGSSRREIGHGALAERALLPVLPSEEEFSYT